MTSKNGPVWKSQRSSAVESVVFQIAGVVSSILENCLKVFGLKVDEVLTFDTQ